VVHIYFYLLFRRALLDLSILSLISYLFLMGFLFSGLAI